jgi:hypothetical protein
MNEFQLKDGRGFAAIPTGGVLTFEIQGVAKRKEIREKRDCNFY